MVSVVVGGMEIELGCHVVSQADKEILDALEEEHECMESVFVDDEIEHPLGEWYEGDIGDCNKCLDEDDVYIEFEGMDERDLTEDEFVIENTEYDFKEQFKNTEGDWFVACQHVSKGQYRAEIDIADVDFDPAKLKFLTKQYTGDYIYTDRMISSVEYDGEELEFECDGTRSKAFEYDVYPFADVKEEG
jgi:hypothetical protein